MTLVCYVWPPGFEEKPFFDRLLPPVSWENVRQNFVINHGGSSSPLNREGSSSSPIF